MTYPHLETLDDLNSYFSDFKEGVEGLKHLSSGYCPSCDTCEDCGHSEECCEPSFSWSPCDICRRRLGGDRYPAHYLDSNDEASHISICCDCVIFMEYGRLDDELMWTIKQNTEGR